MYPFLASKLCTSPLRSHIFSGFPRIGIISRYAKTNVHYKLNLLAFHVTGVLQRFGRHFVGTVWCRIIFFSFTTTSGYSSLLTTLVEKKIINGVFYLCLWTVLNLILNLI